MRQPGNAEGARTEDKPLAALLAHPPAGYLVKARQDPRMVTPRCSVNLNDEGPRGGGRLGLRKSGYDGDRRDTWWLLLLDGMRRVSNGLLEGALGQVGVE